MSLTKIWALMLKTRAFICNLKTYEFCLFQNSEISSQKILTNKDRMPLKNT